MAGYCPICKSQVKQKLPGVWPFCSERCKMIDLGAWMREDYRIPDRLSPEDASSEETGDSAEPEPAKARH